RLKQATAAPCSMWSWARSPSSLGSSGGIGICDGPEGGVGMAGDNLNVFYDSGGDHLEIVFDPKAGSYEKTSLENVLCKRDAEGNLRAISISQLSSFAGPRPVGESISGPGGGPASTLDIENPHSLDCDAPRRSAVYRRRKERVGFPPRHSYGVPE